MSREIVEMYRLQELVRLHRLGNGCHEVARLLKLGPNQERKYRVAIEKADLLKGDVKKLPATEELRAAVMKYEPPKQPPQQISSAAPWKDKIIHMLDKGAKPTAIFDKLRLEEEKFKASLWAVKRFCRRHQRCREVRPGDVAIPVVTEPGQVAQVDFGYVGRLYDPRAGVVRRAWVFVMVLGHSRHMFCRVVFNQRIETWLDLHAQAFEAFGGVVNTVIPDNLKSAVIRAAFALGDDLSLNRSYREFARHYGFMIDPTPPYDPKKKGKVESAVKYAKRNFFKPRDFADIDECNRRLDKWVGQIAGLRIHGTTGKKPLEVFKQEEAATLLPMPAVRFETVIWKQATVRQDCHFIFDRRQYPVPWRYIGKKIWVRATARTVIAYIDDVRVATHERGKPVPKSVVDSFLPDHRSALRHRSRSYWLSRADALGESVGVYIREVFDSDDVLSMLRTVQAMVTCLEKYPRHRAQAACTRAQFYGNYKYKGLSDILLKGLDMKPLPTTIAPSFGKLDAPRYARKATELLQLDLEVTHEPN